MANNTGLDEADIEPGDFRTRLCQNATGLWFTPPAKFRILKIHAAETRPGKRPPRWEAPDFPRQRPAHCPLTLGNVGGSPTPGTHDAETALAGWGARIRTLECWKNPRCSPRNPSKASLSAGDCEGRSSVWPARERTNTVLITHFPNIKAALGIQINFGDAAIVKPDGHGGVAVVGKISSRDWPSL